MSEHIASVSPEELNLVHHFYEAFARGDAPAMGACYHPQAWFEDPVFGRLEGEDIRAMWQMLLARSRGKLTVRHRNVKAEGATATAQWEAWYPFGASARPVYNRIHASFTFREGRIATHSDRFSRWRWARQALGAQGFWLGWTPLFARKLTTQVRRMLAEFRAATPLS